MVQRTTADQRLPRSELAAYLETLAAEFEGDAEQIHVDVGDKSISLDPTEEVDFSVDVVERSSLLRERRETVEIELSWTP